MNSRNYISKGHHSYPEYTYYTKADACLMWTGNLNQSTLIDACFKALNSVLKEPSSLQPEVALP